MSNEENEASASELAEELIGVLETPIEGVPSIKVLHRGHALRLVKTTLLGLFNETVKQFGPISEE